TSVATCAPTGENARVLRQRGLNIIACAQHDGEVALPELLEDLASAGTQSVFLEGGATLAQSFLDEDLVDQLLLFQSDKVLGVDGVSSPVTLQSVSPAFTERGVERYGADILHRFERKR
ncbi:MAG: dihydrofolate reductase family protein, partial [Pseudomonadota bacterium]